MVFSKRGRSPCKDAVRYASIVVVKEAYNRPLEEAEENYSVRVDDHSVIPY
ncbi:MAG: hypothetical protein QXY50_01580 [Candidatus Caldarchaeum sp.]